VGRVGPRLEYDVRLLRAARGYAGSDDAERLRLAKTACDLSAPECSAYGWELANADRASEAAASYERAFADPSLAAIALSNASGWLVTYYYRHGRTAAALALAERSSGTGSLQGLVTAGHLYEQLGRAEEAEAAYQSAARGYDDWSQLLGFYYRAVTVRKQLEFEPAWKTSLARVFPNGLAPVTTDEAKPERGVVVTRDNEKSRKAGLQAGDIIVGLEGLRVDNLQQYTAINAFFEQEQVKAIAWRGHLSLITGTTPNRLFGIDLRSYPIEGWRER
jgi:tetratricopeptide (TPR) repeat protein